MASVEGETAYVPLEVGYITTIIINSITFRFTILLNVLGIKAVKTTPWLRRIQQRNLASWIIDWYYLFATSTNFIQTRLKHRQLFGQKFISN